MPYCIQCGVKLNDRYTYCPLCSIELEYSSERKEIPPLYPNEVHKISIIKTQANTKEWITIHLAGFFTSLIILLITGIDYYVNSELTWSLYVAISSLFVYLVFTAAVHLKSNPKILYAALNANLGLFLFGLDLLTSNSSWFMTYALPCLISLQLIVIVIGFLIRGVTQSLIKAVIIILVTNIFLIIINEIITSTISWSLITTSILLPVSIFLIYLSSLFKNQHGAQ